jgi:hypothetical protein
MTDHDLPRRHSATSIEPPAVPDDETVARLRQVLGSLSNVSRAYILAQRIAPHDGTPAYDTVGVALVPDPPVTREPRCAASARGATSRSGSRWIA